MLVSKKHNKKIKRKKLLKYSTTKIIQIWIDLKNWIV